VSLQLGHYLLLSGILFFIGAAGFLVRRNALVALMCIELMLNAVNLTMVAFNRWQTAAPLSEAARASLQRTGNDVTYLIPHHGQIFAFFVIAVAAAEAAVGLAIVLSLYRVRKIVRTDEANLLKDE